MLRDVTVLDSWRAERHTLLRLSLYFHVTLMLTPCLRSRYALRACRARFEAAIIEAD